MEDNLQNIIDEENLKIESEHLQGVQRSQEYVNGEFYSDLISQIYLLGNKYIAEKIDHKVFNIYRERSGAVKEFVKYLAENLEKDMEGLDDKSDR